MFNVVSSQAYAVKRSERFSRSKTESGKEIIHTFLSVFLGDFVLLSFFVGVNHEIDNALWSYKDSDLLLLRSLHTTHCDKTS